MARILVLTNLYPPHHFGGYELSCRDVVELWQRWGHEVTVLTSSTVRSGVTSPAESPADVRRELHIAFDGRELQTWPVTKRLGYERHNQRRLQAALDEVRPDVVSVWHMAGMSLSMLHRMLWRHSRIVGVVCDEWPAYVERTDQWMRLWSLLSPIWRPVGKLTGIPTGYPDVGAGASFCFVSNDLRDRCLKKSRWYFPRSTVTYSGINTDEFPITRRNARADWSWKLKTAGRLDPRKGFDTAIEALAQLPAQSCLEILSSADAPYRLELEQIARRAGVDDRVTFSTTDRAGVRAAFMGADAVIFPSVWEEPFGLIPLEAMACGTPVAASGTGGSAEFLADGYNCVRFKPGDAASLAEGVTRLATSAELREKVAAAGYDTVTELTVDRLAGVLEAWHLAAADDFRRGVPGPPRDMRRYVPGSREVGGQREPRDQPDA